MQEEPRWLNDDETHAWLALAQMMFQLPAALDAQLVRDHGLTLFDYFVLARLSMSEGRTLRMSQLADVVHGSLSRLSNVVKRLEQRGLVRREPDPGNARYTNAFLTEAGWELVVEAAPGHVEAVRRMVFDDMTPEQIEGLRSVGCHIGRRVARETGQPLGFGRPRC